MTDADRGSPGGERDGDGRAGDAELAARVAELEETLEALQSELTEPPRGPFGLPRPPSPGELLRFTERHAIPTAIAVLEAQVRALKLLQGGIRLVDSERAVREESSRTRDRAEQAGRAVVGRLDDALADLQTEIEEGDLPPGGEARDIIEDARSLTGEIDDRLRRGPVADTDGVDGEPSPGEDGKSDAAGVPGDADESEQESAVQIDVEGELQSIKDELDEESGDGEARNDGSAGAGDEDAPDETDDDATDPD